MKRTIAMNMTKETKGTYVFTELKDSGEPVSGNFDPAAYVGIMYIRKRTFNGGERPMNITVTISTED